MECAAETTTDISHKCCFSGSRNDEYQCENNIPVIIWQKLQLGILVDVNETAKIIRTVFIF